MWDIQSYGLNIALPYIYSKEAQLQMYIYRTEKQKRHSQSWCQTFHLLYTQVLPVLEKDMARGSWGSQSTWCCAFASSSRSGLALYARSNRTKQNHELTSPHNQHTVPLFNRCLNLSSKFAMARLLAVVGLVIFLSIHWGGCAFFGQEPKNRLPTPESPQLSNLVIANYVLTWLLLSYFLQTRSRRRLWRKQRSWWQSRRRLWRKQRSWWQSTNNWQRFPRRSIPSGIPSGRQVKRRRASSTTGMTPNRPWIS